MKEDIDALQAPVSSVGAVPAKSYQLIGVIDGRNVTFALPDELETGSFLVFCGGYLLNEYEFTEGRLILPHAPDVEGQRPEIYFVK